MARDTARSLHARALPCEEPQAPPSEQDALQPHHASVRQKAPRQQRGQAPHTAGHFQGVGKEMGQVQRDKPRHAGVKAAHHHA